MSSGSDPSRNRVHGEPITFRGRRLGLAFESRLVTIAPGRARLYDAAEWRDALVVLEQGEIHIECRAGRFRFFAQGAVLVLDGLPLRALHNRSTEAAVLVAVRRARAGGSPPPD
jgi:hypothetical protein